MSRHLEKTIRRDLGEIGPLREELRELGSQAGLPEDRLFDFQVAVSEACANAIEHGAPDVDVDLKIRRWVDRLEVEIFTPGEFSLSSITRAERHEHRGMGLPLMAHLSDHLAFYSEEGGTLVSLTFYLPGRHQLPLPLLADQTGLRQEYSLLSAIVESAPVALFALGADLRLRWMGPSILDRLPRRVQEADLSGLHISDVLPDIRTDVLRDISETGRPYSGERRHQEPSGELSSWRYQVVPLHVDEREAPYDLLIVAWEITEQKRAEEKINAQGELLTGLIDTIPVMVVVYDPSLDRFRLNRHCRDVLGWSHEDAAEDFMAKVYPDPQYRRVVEDYMQSLETGWRDFEVTAKDGSKVLSSWANIRLSDDTAVGIGIDIRESRRAERALRESEEKFSKAFQAAPSLMFLSELDTGRFIEVNDAYCELTGYSRTELVGSTSLELGIYPADARGRLADDLRETGRVGPVETAVRTKKGEVRWVVFSAELMTLGASTCLVGSGQDVTERMATERALGESEARFRTLADNISPFAWMADPSGWIFWYNRRWYDYTGTTFEEMEGWGWRKVHHPEHVDRVLEKLSHCFRTGQVWEDTFPLRGRDGEYRWFLSRAVPIRDDEGNVLRWFGTNTDVTEQREAVRLNEALNEINAMMTRSLDEEEILSSLLGMAVDALGVESAGVAVKTDDGWLPRYGHDLPFQIGERVLADESFPPAQAFAIGGTFVASDYWKEPRYAQAARAAGIRSGLHAPLYVGGRPFGTLDFHYHSEPRTFSPQQIDFATKLAASASLAVQNARLYQAERNIAQNLQAALLKVPDQVAGLRFGHLYRSATRAARVGGDFYDVFQVAEGRVGVLMGDVCGHGVEAATMASLIKETVRAYAHFVAAPDAVLRMANETYSHRQGLEGFITMFFATVDPDTGVLEYASAGHPPPVVWRSGKRAIFLEAPAAPLGAFADSAYVLRRVTLQPEDRLLLYTDGVTEARRNGDFFSEGGLLDALSRTGSAEVHQIPARVFREIRTFSSGVLNDDVALLALALDR